MHRRITGHARATHTSASKCQTRFSQMGHHIRRADSESLDRRRDLHVDLSPVRILPSEPTISDRTLRKSCASPADLPREVRSPSASLKKIPAGGSERQRGRRTKFPANASVARTVIDRTEACSAVIVSARRRQPSSDYRTPAMPPWKARLYDADRIIYFPPDYSTRAGDRSPPDAKPARRRRCAR